MRRGKGTVGLTLAVAASASLWAWGGVAGADAPAKAKVELRRAQDEAAPGFSKQTIKGGSETLYVHDKADFVLTPGDVADARLGVDELGKPAALIRFAGPGREKMGALTGDWVNRRLAILVDGQVVFAPVLRTRITDAAMIGGDLGRAEVERIVRSLSGR